MQAIFPMDIQVYSRLGSHYDAYDDGCKWELIKDYTNYTSNTQQVPRRISFPPQSVPPGQTRAFYIAIVETYGDSWPLLSGLVAGSNYLNGVWAQNSRLRVMEGVKLYGISKEMPFGYAIQGTGIFMHEGPGGTSFNMKDAIIRYRESECVKIYILLTMMCPVIEKFLSEHEINDVYSLNTLSILTKPIPAQQILHWTQNYLLTIQVWLLRNRLSLQYQKLQFHGPQ